MCTSRLKVWVLPRRPRKHGNFSGRGGVYWRMPRVSLLLLSSAVLLVPQMPQQPRVPNLEAQRAAMKQLSFLVGEWAGEAHILSGPGAPMELMQTEKAQYRLDGLILMI